LRYCRWQYCSSQGADKRNTYCLYEAENGEAIREAARRAVLPADVVVELAGEGSSILIATFFVLRCLGYTDTGHRDDHMTANRRHMSLSSLSRRPVLIAMMVYSVAYGAATYTVWREATSISDQRKCEKHYLVQTQVVGGSETEGSLIYGATLHFLI
jgi:delta-aminolevulinic acid dehydratase/porphobilinogen synthase